MCVNILRGNIAKFFFLMKYLDYSVSSSMGCEIVWHFLCEIWQFFGRDEGLECTLRSGEDFREAIASRGEVFAGAGAS